MSKKMLFIAVVLMLVSTTAFGAIVQVQTTGLAVAGGSIAVGNSYTTTGGTVSANQSATNSYYAGPFGFGASQTASQGASSDIRATGMTFGWGAVATWVAGFANTWQGQAVW